MSQDPLLLTPGPLTTSMSVKQAMLRDWGSRDAKFLEINSRMRSRLVAMIDGAGAFTCVPMQGSGTFAVEAMIGAFVPPAGKLLVVALMFLGRVGPLAVLGAMAIRGQRRVAMRYAHEDVLVG